MAMDILFLNPPFGHRRPEGLDAPLGIMHLGAVLKEQGHACSLVDNAWQPPEDWSAWSAALDKNPQVVLINSQIRFESDTARGARMALAHNSAPKVIAFGPQASSQAPHLLKTLELDGCVIGEPEELIPHVLAAWQKGGEPVMPGWASLNNPDPGPAPRVDPAGLPDPDYELADYARYIQTTNNAVYLASRGLNRPDAFNQPPLIHALDPEVRLPVERVLRDLETIGRRFSGPYMLLFHDEVFTEERGWVLELCRGLRAKRPGMPFWCFTRPNRMDPELASAMARAGFAGVSMGMESGSNRILRRLGRDMSAQDIEAGFQAARRAGLLTLGSVMLGTPGETWRDVEATIELAGRIRPDRLTMTVTTPLPGTPLYKEYSSDLLATGDADFNYLHTWEGKYPLKLEHLSPEDLQKAVHEVRRAAKPDRAAMLKRIAALALRNPGFRRNTLSLALKAFRRP